MELRRTLSLHTTEKIKENFLIWRYKITDKSDRNKEKGREKELHISTNKKHDKKV